jgi:hypothetical protein
MRTNGRTWMVPMTALLLAVEGASGTVSHEQGQRGAAPCTKATSACTDRVNVAAGPQHLLVSTPSCLDFMLRSQDDVHGYLSDRARREPDRE